MKKTLLTGMLTGVMAMLSAQTTQTAPELQVRELTLQNGMTVWLNEDHTQPRIYGSVVVRAGGKDCPNTGIAHYFEHIMFKGTDRIGTVDYEAERPWLDSITAQYDLLSQTNATVLQRMTPQEIATRRAAIQQHINELSLRAADYAIPNEFSRLVSKYGGTGLNAGTSADMTVYYNTFLPQYTAQWCWLNSERLVHPVFRGFQTELETVYEEKNRASDGLHAAYDAVMRAVFKDQPYAFPVLGSTESLKNPRLSDMAAFYKKYYVAGNMCLILSGDITPDAALTGLLEQTFGRVPSGPLPERATSTIPPFGKGEQVVIRLPIPIIKAEAMVWRAPTDFEPDAMALRLANRLLYDEQAGMLDSLTNVHVVTMAGAMHTAMDDAGATALFVVPKIPFGSMKKAEALVLAQLERLMAGDFSEELLERQKRSLLTELEQEIETSTGRAAMMASVFSQGHRWQDYLDLIGRVRTVSKAEVVAAARKYYGDERLTLRKKYGTGPKETLSQPGYVPLQPRNAGARSAFAQWLDSLPTGQQPVRTVDYDRDVERIAISPHATLYSSRNPVNDIFSFALRYHDGTLHTPLLHYLAEYLDAIGTDSLHKQQLAAAWQRIGVTMKTSVANDRFSIVLTGRDEQLAPALTLLAHFLRAAKSDAKATKELRQEARVADRSFGKQRDDVLRPMLQYAAYGQQSSYLRQPSLKEVKALGGDSLMALFQELQQYDCDLVYCGRRPTALVAQLSQQLLPLDKCHLAAVPTERTLQAVHEPVVYFFHVPKSRQNLVCSYEQLPAQPQWTGRATAQLWGRYMGGGMSGVLFQHIREFRSLAYSTQGELMEPNYARQPQAPQAFVTVTGTQADKTMLVVAAVDSLLRQMPMKTENLDASRQELLSMVQNSYPAFRNIGYTVANGRLLGYNANPARQQADELPQVTQADVERFQRDHVAPNRRLWLVIGDRKQTDFQALARYGRVVELRKEDIYR